MGEILKRLKRRITDSMGNGALVEEYGGREALLTGCTALCDFDDTSVRAETVSGPVTVWGRGLSVCAYRCDLISVKGEITKVELGGGDA